jgi:hypothetical protein
MWKGWLLMCISGCRKIVAWGGLGIPAKLTEEQKQVIKGRPIMTHIPPEWPSNFVRCIASIDAKISDCLERNGYDPALHFGLSLHPPSTEWTEESSETRHHGGHALSEKGNWEDDY